MGENELYWGLFVKVIGKSIVLLFLFGFLLLVWHCYKKGLFKKMKPNLVKEPKKEINTTDQGSVSGDEVVRYTENFLYKILIVLIVIIVVSKFLNYLLLGN